MNWNKIRRHLPKETWLFLSDIHLTEPEEHDKFWKNYKSATHHPDGDLSQLLEEFEVTNQGYSHHLVFNGDNFDFRLVLSQPDGRKLDHGMPATPSNSAYKIKRILKDHSPVMAALARFVEAGGTIHFIPGNHDLELNFTSVRRELRNHLFDLSTGQMKKRNFYKKLRFYQNHICIPGFFYAEHGHHYDPFCTLPQYRTIINKSLNGKKEMVLPFGDYCSIFLTNKMGHFNPFHSESYILTSWQYVKIFFKYNLPNLFTRYSLPWTWASGSFMTFFKGLILAFRLRTDKKSKLPADSSLAKKSLRRIQKLYPVNIMKNPGLMIRTLWLDRLALGSLVAVFLASLLISPWSLAFSPLIAGGFWGYYRNKKMTDDLSPDNYETDRVIRNLARITNVPNIVTGHTHHPRKTQLPNDSCHYDLGSWSPFFNDIECTKPNYKKRYFLILSRDWRGIDSHFGNWNDFQIQGLQEADLKKKTRSA